MKDTLYFGEKEFMMQVLIDEKIAYCDPLCGLMLRVPPYVLNSANR
ncbi:hypothetical protein EMIT074MI3_11534 [Bacillus licheniformis]